MGTVTRETPAMAEEKSDEQLETEFKEAADRLSTKIKKTLTDEELKEVYALFKQGSIGDVNTARPGMLDFKGKAKWDAWNEKKGLDVEEAMKAYIAYVKKMEEKHGLIA